MRLVLIILITFSLKFTASACSCGKLKPLKRSMLTDSTSVFIGIVKSIETVEDNDWEVIITFEVEDDLHNVDQDLIQIRTDSPKTSCWNGFEVGQTWYIFSSYQNDVLYAGFCGRSMNVDKFEIRPYLDEYEGQKFFKQDLKYIRRKAKRFYNDYRRLYRWYW